MKQRAAIYYSTSFGRNDGCPLYYFESLKRIKDLEVVHLDPRGDTSEFGKFDYHFWVDWGEDGLPVDHDWMPPQDGGHTVYVCSDAHINKEGREYRFGRAQKFDYVFFNQKKFMPEFAEYLLQHKATGKPKYWEFLPHAVEPLAYPYFEIIKRWDVGFIGHIQDVKNYNGFSRIDFLDRMFKEFPNFYFGSRSSLKQGVNMFEDAARKFCQSRVVLNISIKEDINMRVFETMATGSFLLTNYIPTLGDLFEDGKHLVTYKTLDEAVEKTKYYLTHEEEREKIAKAGQKEVLAKHKYQDRVEHILKIINSKKV